MFSSPGPWYSYPSIIANPQLTVQSHNSILPPRPTSWYLAVGSYPRQLPWFCSPPVLLVCSRTSSLFVHSKSMNECLLYTNKYMLLWSSGNPQIMGTKSCLGNSHCPGRGRTRAEEGEIQHNVHKFQTKLLGKTSPKRALGSETWAEFYMELRRRTSNSSAPFEININSVGAP